MPKIALTDFAAAHAALRRFASPPAKSFYRLENMRRFMGYLGNPQDRLKTVHVAGTSGKTSTCYYIAALLKEADKKTGLSVSPYVHEINERVQVGLNPLPERDFCGEFAVFLDIAQQSDIELTRFELLTAFAFWEFDRQKVDYAVMEVGLGGKLDATNVITRQDKICVITDIGLDHQDKLGQTLAEIAAKKAAIIQLHNRVFAYRQSGEILARISGRTRQKQGDLRIVEPQKLPDKFGFLPLFQQRNFGLAAKTVQGICERDGIKQLNDGASLRAAQAVVPARMETLQLEGKTVIIDGAHNEQKLAALAASLRHRYGNQPVAVLAAFRANRHGRTEAAAGVLTKLAHHIITTGYGDLGSGEPCGEDPDVVAALCKISGFWSVEAIADPRHALRQLLARPEPILVVTGSFYLLSCIYPLLGRQSQR